MISSASRAFMLLNASLPLIVNLYESQYRRLDEAVSFPRNPDDFGLPVVETFDFIIVGAGSAGCVVARRLAAKYKVLLLEAGGDPPPPEDIPGLAQLTKFVPSINWIFGSTKQLNAALDTNGIIIATAGKMMGGSGSHNHCHYERGHPRDFDNWANITGDESWKYDNILQYFLRIENYQGKFPLWGRSGITHSKGGLMDIISTEFTFNENIWYSAGKELGYKVNVDSNGPQQQGFGPAEYNRRKGRRVSTFSAFVKPIEKEWINLTVRRYSVVSEIMFEGKKAIGVQYEQHGIPKTAYVSKEVILSAGAYLSPVILMRSGVGPKEQVASLNKTLVAELPVGQMLNDHIIVKMPPITVQDKSVFKHSLNSLNQSELNNYVNTGEGFLASYAALQEAYIASTRAALRDNHPDWPDIQLYFEHGYFNNEDVLTCNVNINRPSSRGTITVNATNNAESLESRILPVIDYNFFSEESDYDVVIEGIKICRKIVEETSAFQKIGAKFAWNTAPAQCGPPNNQWDRDYWKCYIRHRSASNYHVTSTNRMGRADDPNAVVDSKLRIRGLTGIRVVDASVMPAVTNGNINAPVMMIAEKAAVDIAQSHQEPVPPPVPRPITWEQTLGGPGSRPVPNYLGTSFLPPYPNYY